ncbi:MAG: M23 family metallopeptidase [Candidatus Limnocylindrales bacterium]
MPAIGTRAALARTRPLRLLGLALTLLFLASIGAAALPPTAEAKDWRPQIGATRRAQVYWESIMRSADAELRSLKRTKKQTERKLKSVKRNLRAAVERRGAAKRKLKDARSALDETRAAVKAALAPVPPPPLAANALGVLVASPPPALAPSSLIRTIEVADDATEAPTEAPAETSTQIGDKAIKTLERQVKKTKRDFKQAKRKAKRRARNARSLQGRVRSIEVATRAATARRESAERNLGAWILAMTRYGRLRATKKSDVRPGVNSPFAWPVRGSISQSFHAGHDGLDIVRYDGAPIRSMAFGVVTYVGWNPWDEHGRAFMVVVTHAGGYETLYGHLKPKRIVRVGEEVRKGQVIGYMGNTGNSTGPHLHLELRRGRTTLDPLGVL